MGYRNDKSHRCTKKYPRCYAILSCKRHDVDIVRCECNRAFFRISFERHRAEKSYNVKSLVRISWNL